MFVSAAVMTLAQEGKIDPKKPAKDYAPHLDFAFDAPVTLVPLRSARSDHDTLTRDELAWLERDEGRWRRAHEIAARHPGMDVSGVYRVLRNLEKSPSERLRAALRHGRLFRTHARRAGGPTDEASRVGRMTAWSQRHDPVA